MSLSPGSRLGPYEVVGSLGAGGMGEVYRARDVALGRDVALKVLPDAFADDPERLARFAREAKTLASLNHQHIAQIYGIEGRALVMELVEGEDLGQRITRGAIPLDEALPIAAQIAEALDVAHEQGIIHRDLKPANIKVRPDGTVKVLDFGLAKAIEQTPGRPSTALGASRDRAPDALLNSPTITSPGGMTMRGTILGTAAYMSPEQARGQAVDKRADIWAFGCVVYEMLTGVRPFDGETITDLLASVVRSEPDWSRLPADVPAHVRAVLRRCLVKDPRHRLRDIGDALHELRASPPPAAAAPGARITDRPWLRRAGVVVLILGAAVAGWAIRSRPAPADRPASPIQLDLLMPEGHELFTLSGSPIGISRDGSKVSFVAVGHGARQVFVRELSRPEATPLRGTDAATHADFSPDGASLALVTRDRTLKRISLIDELITDIGSGTAVGFHRPVWTGDDHLVYTLKGLWRISVGGGERAALTELDPAREEGVHLPSASTSDGAVLFTSWDTRGLSPRVEAVGPALGRRTVVVDRASSAMVSPTGHLLFVRNGAVLAAPFDASALRVTGEAVQVIPRGVVRFQATHPVMSLSQTGILAYAPAATGLARLVRVSQAGVARPITDTARHYSHPRVSPDGHRVVVDNAGESLWIHDLSRDARTPLTAGQLPGVSFPVWTRDGRRIVYRRLDELWVIDAAGSGDEHLVPHSITGDIPVGVAPDGDTLAILRTSAGTGGDIYALSLSGAWPPRPLISTPGYDGGTDFSPDGRLMVYASTDSSVSQVYLTSFPTIGRKWSVSTRGGTQPRFSRAGHQIYYRDESRMMVVDVAALGGDVRLSAPRVLFDASFTAGALVTIANYDVTPDGEFVMMRAEPSHPRISIILNWIGTLERLMASRPGQ